MIPEPFSQLQLRLDDGSSATICPYGAHVLSWRTSDGKEQLFLSKTAVYQAGMPIRGGVPIIFPQFNETGPLARHGFARNQVWQIVNHKSDRILCKLAHKAPIHAIWPHRFIAMLEVQLLANQLKITLRVTNNSDHVYSFTAALHTYLRVAGIKKVKVTGLKDTKYLDTLTGNNEVFSDKQLTVSGEVDSIFYDVPREISLEEPGRSLSIGLKGFKDLVVWNPGSANGAKIKDLEPKGFDRFLCLEPASIGIPVELPVGETWEGCQTLTLGGA